MKLTAGLIVIVAVMGTTALAQPEAHLGYVYPAGGRRGTTFQATVGGRNLYATEAYFSGAGVSAKVMRQERQVTPTEQKELHEALNKIQEKRKLGMLITPEEAKSAEEIKDKLNKFGRQLNNPSLGDFVTMQVTIAADAAVGNRELRLITPAGMSNPMVFNIGDVAEVSKIDWKDVPKSKETMDAEVDRKPAVKDVALPITVNGQIPPGGADRYRFAGKAGQRIVVVGRARELIPFISDAVPGWFQLTATLFDAKGEEVASAEDYPLRPDPVLCFKLPADGDYVLEIRDSLYRGREDFIYRVTIGQLPFITGLFPLGGRAGTQTEMAAMGWNLPFEKMAVDLREKPAGIHLIGKEPIANRVAVMADQLPECREIEPNNTLEKAQRVTLPLVINGRIDRAGDVDVFCFDGHAGQRIVAEVYARRLDSPLDSFLKITDATGKQLAFNDDHEDKGSGLNTHYADSYVALTLPAAGTYFVHLGDTQQGGGPAYAYRLRISEPRPDFELRATPSAINVHGAASAAVTVHALRKDGFNGPISLRLKGAPRGFTLTGAIVPENQDNVRFTLNAPSQPTEPFDLCIEGVGTIDGREVVRVAAPADDVMQAFAYRHLVPAQELKVAVFGRFRPGGDVSRVVEQMPVRIPVNGIARIRVQMAAGPLSSKVEYELSDPPDGISIKEATATEIVIQADGAKVKPGMRGNLIVKASAERPSPPGGGGGVANRQRISLGALPAVGYEIVAP